MTKGVFLQAFGKRGYGFSAANLAMSIKMQSPDIPITLAIDQNALRYIIDHYRKFFDNIIVIEVKHEPGRQKIAAYNMLPYDYNLYIDVDTLCLKDINPLFDELIEAGGNYYTHVVGSHTIDKGNDFKAMQWAWAEDIWKHYKLSNEAVLPATNSSFQFIKKDKYSKKLFEQIEKNFANPIPLEKLRMKWGGTQPDELYLNVALAQTKTDASAGTNKMFFGGMISSKNEAEIIQDHYFLSIYGGKGFTKLRYTEWYDRLVIKAMKHFGINVRYKVADILNDKHVNNKKWKPLSL